MRSFIFSFRPFARQCLVGTLLLTVWASHGQNSKPQPAPSPAPTSVAAPVAAPPSAPVQVASGTSADVIIDLQGNELPGQVLEVTPTQVVYRPAGSDVSLPPTILDKSTLFMVRFANGSRETFAQPAPAPVAGNIAAVNSNPYNEAQLTQQARADALRYHSYKGAFWGTYGATMIGGLIGAAAVGGVISSAQPSIERDPIPNRALLQQPIYREAYVGQIRRRKGGKALEGFGAAIATVVGLVLVIVASASQ